MGLMVGPLCYLAVSKLKKTLGYDDSLDAFGIHGVGGTFGALATGVFASSAVNPAAADGLLSGNVSLLGVQLVAVATAGLFAAGVTYLIMKAMSKVAKLRVSAEDEENGLDISLHGETAYEYTESNSIVLSA